MAADLRASALEQAELLSSRLKELLSSGQGYIRTQFGVDLGLKPELYPTWVLLSTAVLGLLLVLLLSWAALCGGLSAGKRRGGPVIQAGEPLKAPAVKTARPEEQQKKRSKKKSAEKKAQSNGQPVVAPQEEVKISEPVSKQSQEIKVEKASVEKAAVQVKKNKKKAKAEVKPTQGVSTAEGKEPDDGAWETKVSNREKRQQRRKDKGPDESGSPGGAEAPKYRVEATVAPAPSSNRKNRENTLSRPGGKGDVSSGAPAPSSWKEEPSLNGGGWTGVPLKIPGQIMSMEEKWVGVSTAPHRRAKPETQSWVQETQVSWSGMDGRMKPDHSQVAFSMLTMKTTEPISHPIDLQWDNPPAVDDEWSGFNGMTAADPSSDWNAPADYWGNYEEPPAFVTPAPPLNEQPAPHKLSDDEKEPEDPTAAASKSKRKKKKKKKAEEEVESSALIHVSSSLNNQLEQMWEGLTPAQKKKVRNET